MCVHRSGEALGMACCLLAINSCSTITTIGLPEVCFDDCCNSRGVTGHSLECLHERAV